MILAIMLISRSLKQAEHLAVIDLSQRGHVHDLGVCLTTVFLQSITNVSVSLYSRRPSV